MKSIKWRKITYHVSLIDNIYNKIKGLPISMINYKQYYFEMYNVNHVLCPIWYH